MGYQFQIVGEMFDLVSQSLPFRIALGDFQSVTGQAGMVGIQINLKRFIQLGRGRGWLRQRLWIVGLSVKAERICPALARKSASLSESNAMASLGCMISNSHYEPKC
ncbi:MAG: hypothetical protein WCI11_00230 [Candidatus Methylumidiphilus sp.]